METYNKVSIYGFNRHPRSWQPNLRRDCAANSLRVRFEFYTTAPDASVLSLPASHRNPKQHQKSPQSDSAASLNRIIRTSGLIFIFMLTRFSILLWVQTKFPDWEKGPGCCTDCCIHREKRLRSQTLTSKSQSHHLFLVFFFFHQCRHTEKPVSLKL